MRGNNMTGGRKRLLSLALAMLLLLSHLPAAAFAAETGGVRNVNTGAVYETVSAAALDAAPGETLKLLEDLAEYRVWITENVTLDLNGHVLTAGYVACFGNIVDRDARKNGTLAVPRECLLLQKGNEMLPVKTAGGYKFIAVTGFHKALINGRYCFQPLFEPAGHQLLKAGAAATGVTVNVGISWTQQEESRSQLFVYGDHLLTGYTGSWDPRNDRYSKMFSLSLRDAEALEDLTYTTRISSRTGVTIDSESIRPAAPSDKFLPQEGIAELESGRAYALGELFAAIDGAEIRSDGVTVAITDRNPQNDSTVTLVYRPDPGDWTLGTVTFTGSEAIDISIGDNYLCRRATLSNVQILIRDGEDPEPSEPTVPPEPDSPWAVKRISILGDDLSLDGWPGILSGMTGAYIQNLSFAGAKLAGDLTDTVAQVAEDADLVILLGGTNDYRSAAVDIAAADSGDGATFLGALGHIRDYLKANRPAAQYLFVFPPDQASGTDLGKGSLEDFRAAFLRFCADNNVAHLDLGDTEFDPVLHTVDGVLPNGAGHQIMAEAVLEAITAGPEPSADSFTATRQLRLLPDVVRDLPEGALAEAPVPDAANAPYAYLDPGLFALRHITRIGIPVKTVSALDENQTFTLSVVKTTSESYQYVSQLELKLPLEQLGPFTTVNRWIYLDVDIRLAADETLAFGMPGDTVQWGCLNREQAPYACRSADGSWETGSGISMLFDVYVTETHLFTHNGTGYVSTASSSAFPNVLTDFPESSIASSDPMSTADFPCSYTDQDLFSGRRITRIGVPVLSVTSTEENPFFTLSVVKKGTGDYTYVSRHTLELPAEQLDGSTDLNRWVYWDVDIPVGAEETLAFGSGEDTILWAWKSGYSGDAYQFRNGAGNSAGGIFFDIRSETVLTYEAYQQQLWEQQSRLDAEQAQARLDARLREVLSGSGISILGDSISTFQGWSNSAAYNPTIVSNPAYYFGDSAIASVSETWWMQAITRTGMELVVNNSWSGDEVTGLGASRAVQLHDNEGRAPRIIAVYLGVNDFRRGKSLDVFREKYEEMLQVMLDRYPGADVYLFTQIYTANMESTVHDPGDMVLFNQVIGEMSEKYGCTLVDLYGNSGITPENLAAYMCDGNLHPNYAGMDRITQCFIDALAANWLPVGGA